MIPTAAHACPDIKEADVDAAIEHMISLRNWHLLASLDITPNGRHVLYRKVPPDECSLVFEKIDVHQYLVFA